MTHCYKAGQRHDDPTRPRRPSSASPPPRRHRSVHARTHSHAARPLAGRAPSALLDRYLRRASWGRGCESMAGRTRASGSVPDFDFHVRRASIQSIPFAGRGRTKGTGPQRSSLAPATSLRAQQSPSDVGVKHCAARALAGRALLVASTRIMGQRMAVDGMADDGRPPTNMSHATCNLGPN